MRGGSSATSSASTRALPLQELYRSILRQESALRPTTPGGPADDHVGDVVRALLAGRLVTVIGPGVHAVDGADDGALPALGDVTTHLASVFHCPTERTRDLAQVAEYVTVTSGARPLYDELHALFDRECPPGPVHRALADLATSLRERDAPRQLLVTTNYDRLLEQAFDAAREELETVVYLALGRHRGKFLHLRSGGEVSVVELPNTYTQLSLDSTTVLFKIHGGVDARPGREWESFVVSEDDYIDYLAQAEISVVVPVTLAARLRRSHFLFLGYPLREWSLRVFLHRLFGPEKVAYRSWAIGPEPGEVEQELWRQRGIGTVDVPLDEYLARLRERVAAEVPG
jgi:SIR2-like domain